MVLETSRLILRPFTDTDAPDLYASASDRRVGHSAGWEPHKSVEESLEIIHTVFSTPNTFAVVDKASGRVIGSAGFNDGHQTMLPGPDDEIGYALHPDYWGRGLMTEAVRELLRCGFEELGLAAIWCGHFADNHRSRRVIEKCGFTYRFTDRVWVEVVGKELEELHYALTKEEWKAL
ncbi:MAG: GNAT family N-acetyltransferase [Oscillospiraceae bacterium]|nr:GNAT family N-acetyltransferase [Oscillospiraceae bacterium]